MLLEEAEKRVRQKGIREVSLFVEETKTELKAFYQKRGYVPTKTYRFFYKPL